MKKTVLAAVFTAVAAISFMAGTWHGQAPSPSEAARKVLYYVDPMNPGFRSDVPGTAPCGMALEPVYAEGGGAEAAPLPTGAVKISYERQQLIGVKVAPAETGPMTYTLRLYGKVVPDETRLYRLNASTDSWIREISDVTTGSIVKKGQILAEALAPSYYDAQVTYLIALDNIDRIRRQLGGELRHQQANLADNQVRVAVEALQNLGITDGQIEELANRREALQYLQVRAPSRGVVLSRNITLNQWFEAAAEFYTIADIGRVWVYADVYEDEARHLKPGMKVKIAHSQMGRTFEAAISKSLPLFDPISKTLKVRVDVDNPGYDLRPGMFVDVEIPITITPSLHVPDEAVIDSGTAAIVYVDAGSGIFEPREVQTGWRLGRRVEIKAGLMPEENIVVSGNFLIDSESRMRSAASGGAALRPKDPVCGMKVKKPEADSLGRTATHAGEAYYFCSDGCMEAFLKEPGRFAAGDGMQAHALSQGHTGPEIDNAGRKDSGKTVHSMVHKDSAMDMKRHMDMDKEDALPVASQGAGTVVNWDGPDSGQAAPVK